MNLEDRRAHAFGEGILTRSGGHYAGAFQVDRLGWVYDFSSERWIEIRRFREQRAVLSGQVTVSVGRRLLVFGGERFDIATQRNSLSKAAFLWSPPPDKG